MNSQVDMSNYLKSVAGIAPVIRDNIDWSQRERRLAPPVVDAFHDTGLFRLMTPREFGGAGFEEFEMAPIIEAVAEIDASAGWNLAIGNAVLGMVRGMDESTASEVFSAPKPLAAVTVSPRGVTAQAVEGGYVINGRGGFASGCSQANWMLVLAGLVDGDGAPVQGPNGAPAMRKAALPIEDVELLDTWHSTGLRGTGSSDVLYRSVFVKTARVSDPVIFRPSRLDPLGQIPSFSRLGSELTPVAIGAAARAIAELKLLAAAKPNVDTPSLIRERSDVQVAVARASGLLQAARSTLHGVSNRVAINALDGAAPTLDDLIGMRLSYVTSTELCVTAVDLVHAAAGTSTLSDDSVIGRCWRDVHAVSHHISQQTKYYENAGRVMLGLAPTGPI